MGKNKDVVDVDDLVDEASQGEPGDDVNQDPEVALQDELRASLDEMPDGEPKEAATRLAAMTPQERRKLYEDTLVQTGVRTLGEGTRPGAPSVEAAQRTDEETLSRVQGATIPRGVLDAARRRVKAQGLVTASETAGERRTKDAAALTGLESPAARRSRIQTAREEAPARVASAGKQAQTQAKVTAPKSTPAPKAPAAPKAAKDPKTPRCLDCLNPKRVVMPELHDRFCAQVCAHLWMQREHPGYAGANKKETMGNIQKSPDVQALLDTYTWNADTQSWDKAAAAAPAAAKGGRRKKAS